MSWIPGILAIGVLIVVHEAGHYVVARLCGMRVERFSVGFGPAIASWRRRPGGTKFQLAPIPFGGFVEIKGMNILEEIDPNDAEAYPNRPTWQRFVTIFAGPATNYLFAVVLALGLFTCAGVRIEGRVLDTVSKTEPGYDAHGKLEPGDRIVAVAGRPLERPLGELIARTGTGSTWDPAAWTRSPFVPAHPPIELTVERKGVRVDAAIRPRWDAARGQYRIGVYFETRQPVGAGTAIKEAVSYPVVQTKAILVGLYEWATGKVEGEVAGALGIAQFASEAYQAGWVDFIALLMILNVYLGLFNLFPLPALDGGRLVFLGYELITRRRANPRLEATVHMVGVLVLSVLLVVVLVNDIRRL
jgi:regulator of sigma E protease